MIIFQFIIATIILISSCFGLPIYLWTTTFLLLFTFANVFTIQLLVIQINTIISTSIIGFIIATTVSCIKSYNENRKKLIFPISLIITVMAYFLNFYFFIICIVLIVLYLLFINKNYIEQVFKKVTVNKISKAIVAYIIYLLVLIGTLYLGCCFGLSFSSNDNLQELFPGLLITYIAVFIFGGSMVLNELELENAGCASNIILYIITYKIIKMITHTYLFTHF